MKKGDLLEALEQIGQGYSVDRKVIIEALEAALTAASRKITGQHLPIRVEIDEEQGRMVYYSKRKVVSKPADSLVEMSLEEARTVKPDAQVGDEVETEAHWEAFGRIAAQTVRQVVMQRMREVERDQTYDRFKDVIGNVVSAAAQRFEGEDVIVDLAGVEALLPRREQIFKETLQRGEVIKFYVLEVRRGGHSPQVIVSRTHPGLLKRLMELEIPEIGRGLVEVKAVGREPGYRAKVAVIAKDKFIDPIGTCIGPKSSRTLAITRELQGEKIDIVLWSDDVKTLITNSLSPARLSSLQLDEEHKRVLVTVTDDQLSLAIGKKGQNARLVSKLTGWRIDIQSETVKADGRKDTIQLLVQLGDVTEEVAQRLVDAGYSTPAMLFAAKPDDLTRVEGVDRGLADKIIKAAGLFLQAAAASAPRVPES